MNWTWASLGEEEGCRHAAGAHRFIKPVSGWTPPDVKDSDGNTVIDSEGVLKAETRKYKALRDATEIPCVKFFAANDPCEKILVSKLRHTSKAFKKKKTGVAPDGWHPRRFSLLSDDGLETLADLYELLKIRGHPPQQQAQVYIFLILKASGGARPIGIFTSYYRLWSKVRQDNAAKWAGLNDRAFFSRRGKPVYHRSGVAPQHQDPEGRRGEAQRGDPRLGSQEVL